VCQTCSSFWNIADSCLALYAGLPNYLFGISEHTRPSLSLNVSFAIFTDTGYALIL
jgi:hypothetical protein